MPPCPSYTNPEFDALSFLQGLGRYRGLSRRPRLFHLAPSLIISLLSPYPFLTTTFLPSLVFRTTRLSLKTIRLSKSASLISRNSPPDTPPRNVPLIETKQVRILLQAQSHASSTLWSNSNLYSTHCHRQLISRLINGRFLHKNERPISYYQ